MTARPRYRYGFVRIGLLWLGLVLPALLAGLASSAAAEVRNNGPSVAPRVFSCSEVTEIPQAECEALVALYNSTNGPGWTNQGGWLTADTPCSWHGVICRDGYVTGLGLSLNQLSGPIPPELGNLANLRVLRLFYNRLRRPIPQELGNLANLAELVLYHNDLGGPIPPELGNLANLELLWLTNNQLSGPIPPELGNLWMLEWLLVGYNQLSGPIPSEAGNLANLGWLDLRNNPLSGPLPVSLTHLRLYVFRFDETELSEPGDKVSQAWLAGIPDLRPMGILCPTPTGTAKPLLKLTPTAAGLRGALQEEQARLERLMPAMEDPGMWLGLVCSPLIGVGVLIWLIVRTWRRSPPKRHWGPAYMDRREVVLGCPVVPDG